MKLPLPRFPLHTLVVILTTLSAPMASAQDPSIERLLKKLPPPEKLVKPSVARAIDQPDPALRDPLVAQIASAAQSNNIGRGLDLARQLCAKHPKSAGAECLRGMVALIARQYAEAAAAFRSSTSRQPGFSMSYFGLPRSPSRKDDTERRFPIFECSLDWNRNIFSDGWL